MTYERPPAKAWLILAIALVGVSSGGPLLASMDVPPVLRASWRLWATSIVLLPGFIVQLKWTGNEGYDLRTVSMISLSGLALAIHFAAWTWSLDHTSLAHSLLFVTSHPIVIVSAMFVIERKADALLITGASLGFPMLDPIAGFLFGIHRRGFGFTRCFRFRLCDICWRCCSLSWSGSRRSLLGCRQNSQIELQDASFHLCFPCYYRICHYPNAAFGIDRIRRFFD